MQLFEPIPKKKGPRVRLRLQAKWNGWSQIDSKSSQLSHGPLRIGFLQCRTEKKRDAVDTSPSFPSKMALARKLWLKICGKWKHQVARYGVYDIIWYYMNYCMWISWAFHVEKLPCYWIIGQLWNIEILRQRVSLVNQPRAVEQSGRPLGWESFL